MPNEDKTESDSFTRAMCAAARQLERDRKIVATIPELVADITSLKPRYSGDGKLAQLLDIVHALAIALRASHDLNSTSEEMQIAIYRHATESDKQNV